MPRLSDSLPFNDFLFKVLNDSSIKAVFHSSRIASNTFVAVLLNVFRSNVIINLVTRSVRIEQTKFVSSAVHFVVFFSVTSTTYFMFNSLKIFQNMITCRPLVPFLLPLFHINKRN